MHISGEGLSYPLHTLRVTGNMARFGGGVLALVNVPLPLHLRHVSLYGNRVSSGAPPRVVEAGSSSFGGGGLLAVLSTVLHDNCNVSGNSALWGGNVALLDASFTAAPRPLPPAAAPPRLPPPQPVGMNSRAQLAGTGSTPPCAKGATSSALAAAEWHT